MHILPKHLLPAVHALALIGGHLHRMAALAVSVDKLTCPVPQYIDHSLSTSLSSILSSSGLGAVAGGGG